MESLKNLFGNRVRLLRKLRGLTQEELSEAANIHSTYLSEVERGETNVSIDIVERIAEAFDVPVYYLFQFALEDANDEQHVALERINIKLSQMSHKEVLRVERVLDVLLE